MPNPQRPPMKFREAVRLDRLYSRLNTQNAEQRAEWLRARAIVDAGTAFIEALDGFDADFASKAHLKLRALERGKEIQ